MGLSLSSSAGDLPMRRIRFWQHGRAVSQMLLAYAPGTDASVDHIRAAGFLTRLTVQHLLFHVLCPRTGLVYSHARRDGGHHVRAP